VKRPLAMLVLVAACAAPTAVVTTTPPTATMTVQPGGTVGQVTPQPVTPDSATPQPDPTESAPTTFAVGEPVTVTEGGEDWAVITITQVTQHNRYEGEFGPDVPEQKGNVFLQLFVTYKALTDGVDYNPYDWQVFVNDQAAADTAFTSYGPTPELSSGTLPKGRAASGWLVYEVPARGRVVISYGGSFSNEAPVFEVLLRE
jgi:hypothetical protein